jgi:hypothetical protein
MRVYNKVQVTFCDLILTQFNLGLNRFYSHNSSGPEAGLDGVLNNSKAPERLVESPNPMEMGFTGTAPEGALLR